MSHNYEAELENYLDANWEILCSDFIALEEQNETEVHSKFIKYVIDAMERTMK